MALPSFSEIFTDNITEDKLDAINAEFELTTLRDLCLMYNSNVPPTNTVGGEEERDQIEIVEIKDDKLAMIIALWMRNITIPETITWGKPYDHGIRESIIAGENEDRKEANKFGQNYYISRARSTTYYRVMKHPQQLLGFLTSAITATDDSLRNKTNQPTNQDMQFYNGDKQIFMGHIYDYNKRNIFLEQLKDLANSLSFNIQIVDHRVFLGLLHKLKTIDLIYILLVSSYLSKYRYILSDVSHNSKIWAYEAIYYPCNYSHLIIRGSSS